MSENILNKTKFIEILNSIQIPVNEGIQSDKNTNTYPRVAFEEYLWEPIMASDEEYITNVTYQVSFFSLIPRDPKLLEIRKSFIKNGIVPVINHEYVKEDRCWHSYWPVEVQEELESDK